MKQIRYLMEAALLGLAFLTFKTMSPSAASATGGWIGRTIGPRLAASKKALKNLQHVMPEKNAAEHQAIITAMWDNLGRVMAEYPHLQAIVHKYADVHGEEHLYALGNDRPFIIIGGHLANWELLPFYFNYKIDWPMSGVYRKPNNPYTARMLDHSRNPEARGTYIAKSSQGVRDMVKVLKDNGRLGQLIDQKYNNGVAADFLGKPAMTSSAFAQLALRFNCPILPMQIARTEGCHFRITFHPPISPDGKTPEELVRIAHDLLEEWIMEKPGQWLWLHRRWDSKVLQ